MHSTDVLRDRPKAEAFFARRCIERQYERARPGLVAQARYAAGKHGPFALYVRDAELPERVRVPVGRWRHHYDCQSDVPDPGLRAARAPQDLDAVSRRGLRSVCPRERRPSCGRRRTVTRSSARSGDSGDDDGPAGPSDGPDGRLRSLIARAS